jgi:hypothetical protein
MAVNDILFAQPSSFGVTGSKRFYVSTGVTVINPGEPVGNKTLGAAAYAIPLATSTPVWNTDYMIGIAESTSTNTATVGGVVDVIPLVTGVLYTILPKVAATYGLGSTPVQATYTALVGSRVTFDLTAGAYTLNSTDAATNGCVVEYQDVKLANGRVLFSIRPSAGYLDYRN